MRGGALPVLTWGGILAVLYAGNWVWEGSPIQMGTTAYAVLAVVLAAGLLTLANRHAVRRGPPPEPDREGELEGVPDVSFAPVGIAVGLASFAFGFTFGHFAIYFGAGLFAFSLARLVLEQRAQRRTLEEVAARRRGGGGEAGEGGR